MHDFFTRVWTDLIGRVVVAILLALVPHLLVRAPVTRLAGKKKETL